MPLRENIKFNLIACAIFITFFFPRNISRAALLSYILQAHIYFSMLCFTLLSPLFGPQ